MSSTTLQRRRFLQSIGLGMGVASLPFYSLIERSVVHAADAAQPPLRLLLLHSGWGGPWDYLRPTGVTDNTRDIPLDAGKLTFANSILEPLKAFTSKMLVIEGIGLTAGLMPLDANTPRTHLVGHDNTDPNRFTGSAINDANKDWVPTSPSLEYFLGKQLGGSNAVRSLQLGIGCTSGTSHSDTLSFNETGQRLPGMTSPADVFKSLFGGVTAGPAAGSSGGAARAGTKKGCRYRARSQRETLAIETRGHRAREARRAPRVAGGHRGAHWRWRQSGRMRDSHASHRNRARGWLRKRRRRFRRTPGCTSTS